MKWGGEQAAWIGGSVVLSSALGALGVLGEHSGYQGFADWAVFWVSGPMFTVYVTGCLIAGGVNRPRVLLPMLLYGVSFPVWGYILGCLLYFVGGTGGVPQAVITALVLRKATRSWIPGVGAVVGLGAGWGTVAMCGHGQHSWELLTFPWHATVVAALVVWVIMVVKKQEIETRPDRGLCPKCSYDRTGLAMSAVCPECGVGPSSA